MNLKNYFWYFSGALTHRFCDHLIEYAKDKKENIAKTGAYNQDGLSKKQIKDLKKKRDSNVVWVDDDWVFREILPYVRRANENAGWNFEWDRSESCQFTKYAPGQFYDWHCDSWEEPYNNPKDTKTHGKIRKLSVTCSLSNPEDYDGGELQFNLNTPERNKKQNLVTCNQITSRGSIVVFPSFVQHRVVPVTRGTRYSLVIWNLGDPFK